MDNKNMPAFPLSSSSNETGTYSLLDARSGFDHIGLSKREMIAMAALQGILANHWCQNDYNKHIEAIGYEETAKQAVGYADALLSHLSTPQP